MKIQATQKSLLSAVLSALRSVGAKSDTDLSGSLLFRLIENDQGKRVWIESFNKVSMAKVPLDAQVESSQFGCFTVEATTLKDCLTSIPDGDAVIDLIYDGKVTFRANKWENILPTQGAKNWPFCDYRIEGSTVETSMGSEAFVEATSKVAPFASKEQTHEPHLCAVYCWDGRIEASSRFGYGIAVGPFSGRFVVSTAVVRPLCEFLRGTEEFTVLKHAEMTSFRRKDGAVFGALTPPGFSKIKDRPQISLTEEVSDRFVVSKDECQRAISFLFTAAAATEKFIGFQTAEDSLGVSEVHLTVRNQATEKDHSIPLCAEVGGNPHKGRFSKIALDAVLAMWEENKIPFDLQVVVSPQGKKSLTARIAEPEKPNGEIRYVYLLNGGQVS